MTVIAGPSGVQGGADPGSIRQQTGHTGGAILSVYDRENAPLEGNAVRDIGLLNATAG